MRHDMLTVKNKQAGVTLLEAVFYLVLVAGLIIFGIRQYTFLRKDSFVQQEQANVDTLFQSLASYYRANCYGSYNPAAVPNPVTTPGALNPVNAVAALAIKTADLVTGGYLTTQIPLNPLVDDGGQGGTNGYVVQFNAYLPMPARNQCVQGPNCTASVQIGQTTIWKAQVAILLKNTAQATQLMNLLGGDCLSDTITNTSNTLVHPCSDKKTGSYVVWERLPSFAAPNNKSQYWLSNPTVKQFQQMYTTYPITYLINMQGQGLPNGNQYFVCGS